MIALCTAIYAHNTYSTYIRSLPNMKSKRVTTILDHVARRIPRPSRTSFRIDSPRDHGGLVHSWSEDIYVRTADFDRK